MNDNNYNNPFNTYKPENESTPLVTPEVNVIEEPPVEDKHKFIIKKQYIIGGILIVLLLSGFITYLVIPKNGKHDMNAKTDVRTTIITNEAGDVIVVPVEEDSTTESEETTSSTETTEVVTNEAGEVIETTTTNNTTKPTTTKPVVSIKVDSTHNTVSALKSANVKVGNTAKTNGYASSGDGGEAYYTIEEKSDQNTNEEYMDIPREALLNIMKHGLI